MEDVKEEKVDYVEVDNLSKRFGNIQAVAGISFRIGKGEVFGLLGPNGAGKTTTISMLSTLLSPDSGDALVDGRSIVKEPMEVKKRIGVVPQEIALYPSLTAVENLDFFGRMYGLPKAILKSRIEEVLEIVGLSERGKERVQTYSGGMKRRINIAVALLPLPELLILDEPTVGVDPQSRTNILETLKQLNKEKGITILYTSHYMEEVEFLCESIAIMDLGKIIAMGTLNELRIIVGEKDSIVISVADDVEQEVLNEVKELPDIDKAETVDKSIHILSLHGRKALPRIIELLVNRGSQIRSIEIKEPNLESVFLELTGRELRD